MYLNIFAMKPPQFMNSSAVPNMETADQEAPLRALSAMIRALYEQLMNHPYHNHPSKN
jgi:hypothetical protein